MALSSATGFRLRKSLYGADLPQALRYRVANSTTVKIGDAVRVNTSGFAVLAAAGNPVLGVISQIVNNEGINVFSLGANQSGGTLTEDDQVATASNNQTRSNADGWIEVAVYVDPSGALLFYNDADGNLAATNLFQCFDVLAASDQIDSASASDSNGQFQLVSIDPDEDGDLSKGLFRIAEGQLAVGVDQGNAVTAA